LLLLGVFEDIALTIRWNVADEWILYDSLGFVIPYYYRLLKPLIEALRREHGDQSLYERIDHLVECWQKQISVRTSKPLEEPSV